MARKALFERPLNYDPRPYQLPFWEAMAKGTKRAALVWHRRAGKDKTALNFLIWQAWQTRGIYYYFYPFANQARKAIWEGMGKDGFRFMHHIPGFTDPDAADSIVFSKRDTDMQVQLRDPNNLDQPGSIIQLIGTDNYDSIRGTNPIGCIYSEYADQDPGAWSAVRPILKENGGWAVFIYTPKGANHGKRLWDIAQREGWFSQLLTIEDTGVLTREDVEQEIREGMDAEFAQQEYYCSFSGNVVGSYYGRLLDRFKSNIKAVPWLPMLPVHVAFDLGVDDMMTLWFFQLPDGPDGEIRIIEYIEGRNEGLSFYAREMRTRSYIYGTCILPHDAEKRNPSERTPQQHMESLGFMTVVVPKSNPVAGIDTARSVLPRCVFDEAKTERGIECLRNYKKQLDPKKDTFGKPVHDWASHGADGFRTLATGLDLVIEEDFAKLQKFANSEFTGYSDVDGLQRQLDDFDPYEHRRS